MTYLQLKRQLLGDETAPAGDPRGVGLAFPLGTPENLRPQLENFILCGMIEIQRYIQCWQVGHIDPMPACSVMVQNGCSVITKPEGVIESVYTVELVDGEWARPIPYTPIDLAYLRRWMSRFRRERRPTFTSRAGADGFRQPSRLDDSPFGRALSGVWTIDARTNRIIVGPWLQSTELLVVRWSGIKRNWADTDIVSDNPDFVRLVMLWLQQEYGRAWASSDLPTRIDTWATAQADAIVECLHNMQVPTQDPSATSDEVAEARDYYAANPPSEPEPVKDSTIICIVGDSGTADANAQAVASAIASQNPDAVVIAGDAVYQPNSVAAALAPYDQFISEGRLVVALGNHDLDLGDAIPDFVSNPGNGRYFNLALPFIEAFVINSGINTAGDSVEPDGNYSGSIMATSITGMISRSCAPWKLAVLHHAPYSSGESYWPGVAAIRWASDLEVHAVVAGHSHNYERGTFRGRKHFVVGTGGAALHPFSSPIDGSEVRESTLGFLRVAASKSKMVVQFIAVPGGETLDEVEFTSDPAPASTAAREAVMSQIYNDTIQAGSTYSLAIFDRLENGQPTDLSGCTAVLQLRRSTGEPVALELSTGSGISITGAAGRIDITMTPEQTRSLVSGDYIYGMEVTFTDSHVEQVIEGVFSVLPEIVVP